MLGGPLVLVTYLVAVPVDQVQAVLSGLWVQFEVQLLSRS